MDQSLVSVGIPTYNRPEGLRRTLECIIGQTYKNLEIIVSDNCSPGLETEVVVSEFMAKDNRIQYYRQNDNKGAHFNFKFVLDKATGKYFMWAADDDLWDPIFIETLINPLTRNQEVSTSFCSYTFIDMDGKLIGSPRDFDYSNNYSIFRIIKFLLYYDDGCVYGLHRRDVIKKAKFPIWWSINSKTPINSAYPPILYLLAAGDFFLVDAGSPLWFNRLRVNTTIKAEYPSKVTRSGNIFFEYVAFVLRKINIMYESEHSIFTSSRSILLVCLAFLPILLRCIFDCMNGLLYGLIRLIKYKLILKGYYDQ